MMANKHNRPKKDKKGKGRREAELLIPKKIAILENLEPVQYWDDWTDYRDGLRDYRDRSRIRPTNIYYWCKERYHVLEDNAKLKRKEIIRRIMKRKRAMKNEISGAGKQKNR